MEAPIMYDEDQEHLVIAFNEDSAIHTLPAARYP